MMFSLAKSSTILDYVNGVCSEFYDSFLNRLYQGIAKTAPSREDIQGVGWLSGLTPGADWLSFLCTSPLISSISLHQFLITYPLLAVVYFIFINLCLSNQVLTK